MNNKQDSWGSDEVYLRYDRTERLQRAPESVQQMYETDYIKKISILKSLTATHSSRSMLFALLAVFAFGVFSFFLQSDRSSGSIHGIPISVEYTVHHDALYVTVVFSETECSGTIELPFTVHITARNRKTGQQKSKLTDVIYIGNGLSVPVQFGSVDYQQLTVVVCTENKTLTLRKHVKK